MTSEAAAAALTRRYLLDYPEEAARRIEAMPIGEAAAVLGAQEPAALAHVWDALADDAAEAMLTALPERAGRIVLAEAEPARAAAILGQLAPEERGRRLAALDGEVARDLAGLLEYPPDSAGRLMDPRALGVRADARVEEALARLRGRRGVGTMREAFVVDDARRLVGRVGVEDLAFAEPSLPAADRAADGGGRPGRRIARGRGRHAEPAGGRGLALVDHAGRLVGVIRQSALVAALQEETSVDVQTMVGASRDERALSSPGFAVRKRLPWLQINLLTAFLAAAVVGLFEATIARFTALAVLLPVVAGQSATPGHRPSRSPCAGSCCARSGFASGRASSARRRASSS